MIIIIVMMMMMIIIIIIIIIIIRENVTTTCYHSNLANLIELESNYLLELVLASSICTECSVLMRAITSN